MNVLWKLVPSDNDHGNTSLLVLESFPDGAHERPEENHQEQEQSQAKSLLWVACWPEIVPDPGTPGKCTAVPRSACEPSLVWERDPIYLGEARSVPPRESPWGSGPLPPRPLCPTELHPGFVSWPLPFPPGPFSAWPSASWHWSLEDWVSSSCSSSSESDSSL